MSTGAVFFAHKKRSTEHNSHLAGEASGSSISNGCHAKTKHRRQLTGGGTGRGGTKLHASVAGSHVTVFLATAAPWEPYFTDNPRTIFSASVLVTGVTCCQNYAMVVPIECGKAYYDFRLRGPHSFQECSLR
jgi:hypothetical protein